HRSVAVLPVLWVNQAAERHFAVLDEAGRGIASDRLDPAAHDDLGPVGLAAIDAAGHVGHQRPQPGFAFAQMLLALHALGDVAEDADDAAVGGAAVSELAPTTTAAEECRSDAGA